MWGVISAISEWRSFSRRKRQLGSRIRDIVSTGSGEVRSIGSIGMLVRSPFRGLGGRPVYLKARCDYPDDRGTWFVKATDDGAERWVWKSIYGKGGLPPGAPADAAVDNSVIVFPFIVTILLWAAGIGAFAYFLWTL